MDDSPLSRAATLPLVRFDHACFGCGDDNPIGLHLQFSPATGGVSAAFTPQRAHQGFDGIVHGGIISTVLDEAMAWATASAGIWSVTAEMSIRFKHPLSVGESTTVTARVTENRGRIVAAAGQLTRDRDAAVIATATATFVRVSDAVAREWEARYLEYGAPDESSVVASPETNGRSNARGEATR